MFPTVIDNSMRVAYVKCPQYFLRKYIENWDNPVPSIHLHAGAAFARGLEITRRAFFDQGLSPAEAEAAGAEALIIAYGDYDPGTHAKTCEKLLSAFTYYFDSFGLATDILKPHKTGGKSAVEFTFAIPLPINHPDTGEPLVYAGRFDMLAEFGHALAIEDDKTATQLGKTWANQWVMASQMTGYVWAAQQYGYNVNCVIVRGVSITAVGNHSTEQFIGYRKPWQIQRWYDQLLFEIQNMIMLYKMYQNAEPDTRYLSFPFNFSTSCSAFGGCEMHTICDSPNPNAWLSTHFTTREYNPLSVND